MSLPKEAIDDAAEVIEELEGKYNERLIARAALGVAYPALYATIRIAVLKEIVEWLNSFSERGEDPGYNYRNAASKLRADFE